MRRLVGIGLGVALAGCTIDWQASFPKLERTENPCASDGECEAGDTCRGGVCVAPPPCTVCETPPPALCLERDTLRTWASQGTCDAATGRCEYEPYNQPCLACGERCLGSVVTCPATSTGGCLAQGHSSGDGECLYVPVADGAPCSVDAGAGVCLAGACVECLEDSDCAVGTCGKQRCVVLGEGAACGDDRQCEGGSCAGGVCCAGGACVGDADGGGCDADPDCQSGHCVDGACCPSACDGWCLACAGHLTGAADGVCAAIRPGLEDVAPTVICGVTGGEACSHAACACDGNGGCAAADGQPCEAPGECGGGACECVDGPCTARACATAECLLDADCARGLCRDRRCLGLGDGAACSEGTQCSGGVCGVAGVCCDGPVCQLVADGAACAGDAECMSDSCVDGVCCESACAEPCSACAAALTGGVDGACGPIRAGLTDEAGEACTRDGKGCGRSTCACDGTGGCAAGVGEPCLARAECGSGACECGHPSCQGGRTCTPRACGLCAIYYAGVCDSDLQGLDGVDDPGECEGEYSCRNGVCAVRDSFPCVTPFDCISNYCECGDAACSTRLCAPVRCEGGYYSPYLQSCIAVP